MKKSKSNTKIIKTRTTYTLDIKASAKRFYLIGLTLQEISKLIDAPVRTIENWQITENWKQLKETTPIQKKALDLKDSGKTYKEISTMLNKSKATIWRYITTAKNDRSNGTK
jgi:DNA-directed RNA polymerase specialized sigma24 family protein